MIREDAISRERLKTAIHNFYYGLKHTPTEEDIQAYIDAAPSVSYSENPNRCGDLISREETLTAFADYVGSGMSMNDYDALWNIVAKMPSVKTQEPCKDAISRQAIIDSLHSKFVDGFDSDRWWNSMSVLYAINKVPSVSTEKTGQCKDCKWWKDSDGVYRRGIGAESKCPINRIEVFEGNGYCYMFEPKESEDKE